MRKNGSRSLCFALGFVGLLACGDDSEGTETVQQPNNPGGGEMMPDAGGAPDPCSLDADSDGVGDCTDECPDDANKTEEGVCGCGTADTDTDMDGTLDCDDACPADATKTEAGVCGCGFSDDADTDEDGSVDCVDECPFDAARSTAGTCGCGASDDLALCLRHRYDFAGEGEALPDLVGDADGTLVNTVLSGTGSLALEGGETEQYVRLPGGIISALGPSVTVEAWVSWTGEGGAWQRIFDFGSSSAGPGMQGNGATYFMMTPLNGTDQAYRTSFTNAGLDQEVFVTSAAPLPANQLVHVAAVIDGPAGTLSLYLQGVLLGVEVIGDRTLARLDDVDNYIGRSQWTFDEEFQGVFEEFRIYSAALNREQLGVLVAAGPDVLPDSLPQPDPDLGGDAGVEPGGVDTGDADAGAPDVDASAAP